MQLASVKIKDSVEWFCDRLVITNDDELMKWGNLRTERAINAICFCVTNFMNDDTIKIKEDHIDLYALAKKYTNDGVVIMSAMETPDMITWESTARQNLVDQYKHMFTCLDNGYHLFVNTAGGYINLNPEDVTYLKQREISDEELNNFIKQMIIPTDKKTREKYFCYDSKGNIFYDESINNHDIILRNNGFREKDLDKTLKLIYYPKYLGYEHDLWQAYGIHGLRESVVYDLANKPFTPSAQDLNKIERFINDKYEVNDVAESI